MHSTQNSQPMKQVGMRLQKRVSTSDLLLLVLHGHTKNLLIMGKKYK